MKAILLNREDFKNLVFARDNQKCVVCGNTAIDAHHIIDRSLFTDGGYYINNGVSLCSEHHLLAESTEISCKELRQLAKIEEAIYPDYIYLTEFIVDYDKWLNPVLKNGKRLKGYYFEKYKNNITPLHLFERDDSGKPDKYGRSYHFNFSKGSTNDDRIAKHYNNFINNEIVITEKLDGENNLLKDGVYTRSRVEPTTNPWSKKMWELYYRIKDDLKDVELYGESLYAEHSIIYSALKEYFYIFGIKDDITDEWFSWDEIEEYSYLLDIPTAPVLFKGKVKSCEELKEMILGFMNEPSKLSNSNIFVTPKEGVVCRLYNRFPNDMFYNSLQKYVRKGHVQTDQHWSKNWKRAKLEYEYE